MSATLNDIFMKNLKTAMGDRSGYWLAKQSGVSQSTISRLLSDQIQASLDTVEALSKALSIPPHELLKSGEPKRTTRIPADILEALEKQDDLFFDTIRSLLKAIAARTVLRKQVSASRKKS